MTTLSNSSIYLDEIFTSNPNDLSQTLPSSPFITQNEIRAAIQTLNINSAPGLDDFTPNFYISFPLLTPILCQTFNNTYLQKKLTSSQSHALIKLIPKNLTLLLLKTGTLYLSLILIIKFYLLLYLPDSNLSSTL